MLAVVALITSAAQAGRWNKVLSVGAQAPDFSGLIGTDDKQHGLSDYKDAELVVVVFTCNSCPVAAACEDRIIALQAKYKDQGVRVVAINVTTSKATNLAR